MDTGSENHHFLPLGSLGNDAQSKAEQDSSHAGPPRGKSDRGQPFLLRDVQQHELTRRSSSVLEPEQQIYIHFPPLDLHANPQSEMFIYKN